ncbi:MAG: Acyl-coenzyme A thioesterase PaaI, contains HGG motif [Chloroflexi bacterium AL-W]|nr:Acyl-coenzyme A thioesterase PaaI, contains HGG motif [Chloroflexi bacterium AL-W]
MTITTDKPIGGTQFMTAQPPHGFGIRFYIQPDGSLAGQLTLDEAKEGPPQHVHGGALIAMLDEAMGACAWQHGYRVVAVNLQFDLKRAVPLNTEIIVRGWVEAKEGRKVWTLGEVLLPGGIVAVSAHGLFLEAPEYVGKPGDYDPFQMDAGK